MALMVRISTPGGSVFEDVVQSVILPCSDGEMGILAGHMSLTALLTTGLLRIQQQKWLTLYIREGLAQIRADEVTVLVQAAEWSDCIDSPQAQAEVEAAVSLSQRSRTSGERVVAEQALKRAQTRLKASLAIDNP